MPLKVACGDVFFLFSIVFFGVFGWIIPYFLTIELKRDTWLKPQKIERFLRLKNKLLGIFLFLIMTSIFSSITISCFFTRENIYNIISYYSYIPEDFIIGLIYGLITINYLATVLSFYFSLALIAILFWKGNQYFEPQLTSNEFIYHLLFESKLALHDNAETKVWIVGHDFFKFPIFFSLALFFATGLTLIQAQLLFFILFLIFDVMVYAFFAGVYIYNARQTNIKVDIEILLPECVKKSAIEAQIHWNDFQFTVWLHRKGTTPSKGYILYKTEDFFKKTLTLSDAVNFSLKIVNGPSIECLLPIKKGIGPSSILLPTTLRVWFKNASAFK